MDCVITGYGEPGGLLTPYSRDPGSTYENKLFENIFESVRTVRITLQTCISNMRYYCIGNQLTFDMQLTDCVTGRFII